MLRFMNDTVFEVRPVKHTGFPDGNFLLFTGKTRFSEQCSQLNQFILVFQTDSVAEQPEFAGADMKVIEIGACKLHGLLLHHKIMAAAR